jgi:hypothetical protein
VLVLGAAGFVNSRGLGRTGVSGGVVVRAVVWVFLWCAVLLSSGCAIWEQETTNRGGFLDHLVDQHWLKADSKSMRALRAFAIQVSLARIASKAEKTDAGRQLAAVAVGGATKRFIPVALCAFEKNPLRVAGAEKDPCFYYDSAMVDYSTALFDLAKVSLPDEEVRKLTGALRGNIVNPLNVGELLETLVSLGRFAFKYGRVVGALYRDTIELEVQLWLATPDIDPRPVGARVTHADVARLKNIYDSKLDSVPLWVEEIAALRGRGLEPYPHPKFFVQLSGLMRYNCGLITRETKAFEACVDGLDKTMPDPIPVLQAISATPSVGTMLGTGVGGRIGRIVTLVPPDRGASYRRLRDLLLPADVETKKYVEGLLGSPPVTPGQILNDQKYAHLYDRISNCIRAREANRPCPAGSLQKFR